MLRACGVKPCIVSIADKVCLTPITPLRGSPGYDNMRVIDPLTVIPFVAFYLSSVEMVQMYIDRSIDGLLLVRDL